MYQLNPIYENVARRLAKNPKLAAKILKDKSDPLYDIAHNLRAKQIIGKKLKPHFADEVSKMMYVPQGGDAEHVFRIGRSVNAGLLSPEEAKKTLDRIRPGWKRRAVKIVPNRSKQFDDMLTYGKTYSDVHKKDLQRLSKIGNTTPLDNKINTRKSGDLKRAFEPSYFDDESYW